MDERRHAAYCLNAADQFCTTASPAVRCSSVLTSCTISRLVPSGETSKPTRYTHENDDEG
jgi:hypothetical protein